MAQLLTEKDVCLLMATYHRPNDIERTLRVLLEQSNIPGEIIIIDQSKDDATKNICAKYKEKLPVKYMHIDTPSADISMNVGLRYAREKYRLIFTSGDDVDYLGGYLTELLKEFNDHPEVIGVAGIEDPVNHDLSLLKNKIRNLILRLFFLPYWKDHQFKVTGPYGQEASPRNIRPIRDASWLPGSSCCFRNEVYEHELWPELRGANVIDDILFSYKVYQKYGKGSLVVQPACKTVHRKSMTGRYPDRKRIFVNHEDHLFFYYQCFFNPLGTFKLATALMGIALGNFLKFLAQPHRENFLRFVYNLEAMHYCHQHRKEIMHGITRRFFDDNLRMIV